MYARPTVVAACVQKKKGILLFLYQISSTKVLSNSLSTICHQLCAAIGDPRECMLQHCGIAPSSIQPPCARKPSHNSGVPILCCAVSMRINGTLSRFHDCPCRSNSRYAVATCLSPGGNMPTNTSAHGQALVPDEAPDHLQACVDVALICTIVIVALNRRLVQTSHVYCKRYICMWSSYEFEVLSRRNAPTHAKRTQPAHNGARNEQRENIFIGIAPEPNLYRHIAFIYAAS